MTALKENTAVAGTPKSLWILYADTFTMAVGFYMLVPLLAFHFLENLSLTIAAVGALAAIRVASQNGLMPVSGWVADRIDYKRAIAIGVLVRAIGFALLGTVTTMPLLVAASILTGVGGALFHPASYAAYSALAEGRDRVRVYSTRELVSNLGFIVGPMIGGLLAGFDFRLVSLGAAALFLIAFVFTVLGLPAGMSSREPGSAGIRAVFANRAFLRYCALASALWLLVSQLYLVVPIRAADVLPGAFGVGIVYTSAALLMVVTMLPLTGFVSHRLPSRMILGVGALSLGAGIAVMGLWATTAGLLVGVGIFTIGQMLSQPVMNAVVAEYAQNGSIASHFGVLGLAQAVGGVVGSLGGGLLYLLAAGGGAGAQVPWLIFLAWGIGVAAAFYKFGPSPSPHHPRTVPPAPL